MFKQIFVNRKPGPRIKDCGTYINWYSVVINLMDDTRMTSMKIVQFSRPFSPLVQLCPKFFHPHDLGRLISNEPPPPPLPPHYLLLAPHYLLLRGFTFLFVQLSKNITKCFFKNAFFSTYFEITCFISIKRK